MWLTLYRPSQEYQGCGLPGMDAEGSCSSRFRGHGEQEVAVVTCTAAMCMACRSSSKQSSVEVVDSRKDGSGAGCFGGHGVHEGPAVRCTGDICIVYKNSPISTMSLALEV